MGKLAVLKIGEGDFEQGFPVILQLGEDGQPPSTEVTGRLPAFPDLPNSYSSWQSVYRQFIGDTRLGKPKSQQSNYSILDVTEKGDELNQNLNTWLNSSPFRPIREKLLQKLNPDDEVRFIIQTSLIPLRQLPWYSWQFFGNYLKAEIAISGQQYERVISAINTRNKIHILAILGDDQGINLNQDIQYLTELTNAKIKFLVRPDRIEINETLWKEAWDILFFAGHSCTEGEIGKIYINDEQSLTINELKYALRQAINSGLQLAIFNSCDGLGLAQELDDLYIPQTIVMREPVPDKVAQEFLKYFLATFVGGKSFYLAVREARERLQGLENEFPCASWLPLISQNPAQMPIKWTTSSNRIRILKNKATQVTKTIITVGLVNRFSKFLLNILSQ